MTAADAADGGSAPPKPDTGATSASAAGIIFTPIYGCFARGGGMGPLCSLLEIGNVRILLDCGWDIGFEAASLAPLRNLLQRKKIDLVLISHADLQHMGGLPYAVGKLGLRAPVFCTLPTLKMGQMMMYDAYLTRTNEGDSPPFSLDDVDAAFALFKPLKFSQHLNFSEKSRGAGITIMPLSAGRLIGGCLWKICWRMEDNDVVYAVAYNHKREKHLNHSAMQELSRPSVLITDSHNMISEKISPRLKGESDLLSTIMSTVRAGGNVLIPTDAAGRVLELLLVLDDYWTKNKLGTYKLVLLHNTAYNTSEFAKSQLEWMSDAISRVFDMKRSNPFELQHVHIAHSLADLEELDAKRADPKVVLTTDKSLDYGFAKALLLAWAEDPKNVVLLTDRGHGDTTARRMLAEMTQPGEHPLMLDLAVPVRVPLQGEELREVLEEEARARRQAAEEEEQCRQAEEMEKGQVIPDSDDEDESGKRAAADGDGGSRPKKRRAISAGLFHKYSKPQHLMFGYHEVHAAMDEYGTKEVEPIGWLAADMQAKTAEGITLEQAEQHMDEDAPKDQENPLGGLAPPGALGRTLSRQVSGYFQDEGVVHTKLEKVHKQVELRARVAYIDMEGLSDGRSIKNLMTTIAPRRLVVIGGTERATGSLVQHMGERCPTTQVLAPRNGQALRVSLDTDVHDVWLHDSLYSKLKWHALRDYEISHLECRVTQQQSKGAGPLLHPPAASDQTGHRALFVSHGEVTLMQLHGALQQAGIPTELQAGALTCNKEIVIRKGKDGKFQLQGPCIDLYFQARAVMQKQYTIL